MTYDVVITEHANETATLHLLSHLKRGQLQEDLCFALWSPSTGNNRTTAIVHKVVLPRRRARTARRRQFSSLIPDPVAPSSQV